MPDGFFAQKVPTDPLRADSILYTVYSIQVPKGSKIALDYEIPCYGERKLKFGMHVDKR